MRRIQMRVNIDGTICLDYYEEELYSSDIPATLVKYVKYLDSKGHKIRRFPFYITKCNKCGQTILTNRDYFDELKCQNCGNTNLCAPVRNNMNRALLKSVHDALGFNLKECDGFVVYMLSFIQKGTDTSLLNDILPAFGFKAEHCEGHIYNRLLEAGSGNGWLREGTKVGFSKTLLDKDDAIMDGTIPRVEACARLLSKLKVDTISIHLSPDEDAEYSAAGKKQEKIDKRALIERLIAEGKFDEALRLVDEL